MRQVIHPRDLDRRRGHSTNYWIGFFLSFIPLTWVLTGLPYIHPLLFVPVLLFASAIVIAVQFHRIPAPRFAFARGLSIGYGLVVLFYVYAIIQLFQWVKGEGLSSAFIASGVPILVYTVAMPPLTGGLGLLVWLRLRSIWDPPLIQNGTLCPSCGYSLVGNQNNRCPECGRAYTEEELRVD